MTGIGEASDEEREDVRKIAQGDYDATSDRISIQVRTIALAIIAMLWGVLFGKDAGALAYKPLLKSCVVVAGALAFVSLVCDYLQYAAGMLCSKNLLSVVESGEKSREKLQYDYDSFLYKARGFFFWGKQWVLFAAVSCLIVVLLAAVL